MPTVSVVMGVYKCDRLLLEKSIDSILKQTYNDFEFIICDDGSADGTFEYLCVLSQNDKRLVIIKNDKNEGLAFSLNKCVSVSNGIYIARQDADDISLPDRIMTEVTFLQNHKEYAFVGTIANYITNGLIWGEWIQPEKPKTKDFLWGSPFIHPTIVFDKIRLLGAGCYRVSKETYRTEDYDLFMRLYAKKCFGYNIQQKLYNFLEDENANKRRKYKYRIDEVVVRYKGFKQLKLLPGGFIYIMKPLAVGLIPIVFLKRLKLLRKRLVLMRRTN